MNPISFARGIPPPEALPVAQLAECACAAVERDGGTVLNYGPAGGYAPLREWVGVRHRVDGGRVLLTNGSLQAIALLAQELLADAPRRVLVEAPTYDRTLTILRNLGAEIVPLRLDDDGLDLDRLERELEGRRYAFLYTIPTFQNPSGRTLDPEQRARLVSLAREHELTIVEDDPYGLVRFEGTPEPTLFELAGGDGVVHLSSFSKTVAPGARVAYAILPPHLVRRVEAAATRTYLTPALLSQATILEFLRRGYLEPHLDRVCRLLRERRDAMLSALDDSFADDDACWSRPEGGYFLWLDLPEGLESAHLLSTAAAAGVTFVGGSDFFAGAGGERSARLAYSFASPADITEGIARLAACARREPRAAVAV